MARVREPRPPPATPNNFPLPGGSKNKYIAKQKRQAPPIEQSHRKRGNSPKTAADRARKTENKRTGGEPKSRSHSH